MGNLRPTVTQKLTILMVTCSKTTESIWMSFNGTVTYG